MQNLASIQKRTSPVKFAHLAEKSGKGSISNLSTKVGLEGRAERRGGGVAEVAGEAQLRERAVRGERRAERLARRVVDLAADLLTFSAFLPSSWILNGPPEVVNDALY